jgi:hypothetical protein
MKSVADLRRANAAQLRRRRQIERLFQEIRLIAWKPLIKGSLRGFASVEMPMGLTLFECAVLISRGKPWVALPSKPVIGQDGKQARDGHKPRYAAILRWRDGDLSDRFSAAVVALVRSAHPVVFDESAAS